LGLAGTTGADFFDYLITDPIVTPESEASWYSEKFVYMPDTYQVNSRPLNFSNAQFGRNDAGLPENSFVYCCFCSNYKIEPTIFRIWMQILKGVPKSVLWLLKSNAIVEENLKKEAQRNGVNPDRLIFATKIDKEDHLQRIRHADFALDTRIVNGAATTSDALYAGVPVLSLKGTHFASRMSASILNAVGLSALVVETQSDYKKKAIEYGRSPSMANRIKERLKTNCLTMPLFDTKRFVRNLEKAYLKMWKRHLKQKAPDTIYVD
jgi:protein O-GlcNAc transferase